MSYFDSNDSKSWALENQDLSKLENFDLIDFVGADDDNIAYGSNDQESKNNREDKLYTVHQYNQMMFNDFQQNGVYQRELDFRKAIKALDEIYLDMHQPQYGIENQYPGVSNYITGQGTSVDGRGILTGNVGYGNVDSTMIPTTSKSGMPVAIKLEPGYEQVDNIGGGPHSYRDDSGAYSDADSYAHSVASVGVFGEEGYKPSTKPRKYRIKPQEEKANPVYKIKREKNNDAVRRSRDKAKRIQLEKDERLAFLETEDVKNKRTIQALQKMNSELQRQLQQVKMMCSCSATNCIGGGM